jgi:hypothetical protein
MKKCFKILLILLKGYGESVGESFLDDNKVRIAKEKKRAIGSGA